MRKIILFTMLIMISLSCICSADAYTQKISDLGAVRFVQEYNTSMYEEYGNRNYFTEPVYNTPARWNSSSCKWPYDLWTSSSIDSRYQLDITVDKHGYVTEVSITASSSDYLSDELKIARKMLSTGHVLSKTNISYLYNNFKLVRGYSFESRISEIILTNSLEIQLGYKVGGNSVGFCGLDPND